MCAYGLISSAVFWPTVRYFSAVLEGNCAPVSPCGWRMTRGLLVSAAVIPGSEVCWFFSDVQRRLGSLMMSSVHRRNPLASCDCDLIAPSRVVAYPHIAALICGLAARDHAFEFEGIRQCFVPEGDETKIGWCFFEHCFVRVPRLWPLPWSANHHKSTCLAEKKVSW